MSARHEEKSSGTVLQEVKPMRTLARHPMNWLRVLGTVELPQIDQGVRQQFHAQMSLLNMCKTA